MVFPYGDHRKEWISVVLYDSEPQQYRPVHLRVRDGHHQADNHNVTDYRHQRRCVGRAPYFDRQTTLYEVRLVGPSPQINRRANTVLVAVDPGVKSVATR